MQTILNMIWLHLSLTLKDRSTYIQAFAVPILLMLILSVAVNEENFGAGNLRLDVWDQDNTALSAEFIAALEQTASASDDSILILCLYGADNPDNCNLKADETFEEVGTERLEERRVTGTVIIPAGFEAALLSSDESAAALPIELRADNTFGGQTLANTTVNSAISQFSTSLAVARAGVAADPEADFEALRVQALAALQNPPALVQHESSDSEVSVGFGARQSVPGQGSMFVLFSLLILGQFIVQEREQGTLQRLLTVPVPRAYIVLGKILGAFLFGVFQFSVFILFGAYLGIDWGGSPLGVAILVIAYCLAGTALGFMLGTLVKTSVQAANIGTMVGLTLAPLGGAWWPLSIVPEFMRTIGHISPIAWLMDGFQELLYYNGGVVDILPEVGVLLLFALVFMTVAVMRFRYE